VKEIYYELLIPGNRESEIHAKEIMNLFIKKKEEITREFLSSKLFCCFPPELLKKDNP